MRIIDRRHDYYDIGLGFGHDDSVVYLREERKIESYRYATGPTFTLYTVGFCGKLHTAMRASHWSSGPGGLIEAWCYSVEDCDKFIARCNDGAVDNYRGRSAKGGRKSIRVSSYIAESSAKHLYIQDRATVACAFKPDYYNDNYRLAYFQKYRAPIIVWTPEKTVANPLLRPYDFFRVKEPYTAFQELEQYLGGVLGEPPMPMPPISDATMQQIKGFDHKYSFRKEPKV